MPTELEVLRKQTADFIKHNPFTINLQRVTTVADGAGGVKSTLAPVGAQTFRIITQSTNTGVFRRTIDGQEVQPDFVLLGQHDADVKNGDWYMYNGRKHEIVYVREPSNNYEHWAEVAYRG